MRFEYPIPLLAALLMSACTGQLPEKTDAGKELLIPLYTSSTGLRSAEGDEAASREQVASLDMLVFSGEGDLQSSSFLYTLKAKKDDAEKDKFLFEFPQTEYGQSRKLILLANAEGEKIKGLSGLKGRNYGEISQQLYGESQQRFSPDSPLPMFGTVNRAEPVKIEKGASSLGNVKLIRNVAKVDIGVGTYDPASGKWVLPAGETRYFQLTDVQVRSAMGRNYYLPQGGKFSYEEDGTPLAIQASGDISQLVGKPWEYAEADISSNGKATYCKGRIYLPETPLGGYSALQEKDRENRTALLLGGYLHDPAHPEWDLSKTWYRLDFTSIDASTPYGELFDLLRNHLYRISFSSPSKRGADTAEEAWKVPEGNIRMEILPWEKGDATEMPITNAGIGIAEAHPAGISAYNHAPPQAITASVYPYAAGLSVSEDGTVAPFDFELVFSSSYAVEVISTEESKGITFTRKADEGNIRDSYNRRKTTYTFTIPARTKGQPLYTGKFKVKTPFQSFAYRELAINVYPI